MDKLIDLVMQATWSLEEAAHLVHTVNPVTQPVELSEISIKPVARTYFWLKKEFGKDRLYAIGGDEQTPRFSPGTIMRHMEAEGRFISKEVRDTYNAAHGHPGLAGTYSDSKRIYLEVAELIWKIHPDKPAAQVANELVDLPDKYSKRELRPYAASAIRKFLNGKGPGKVGRPRTGKKNTDKIDIGVLAAKHSGN